LRSGARASGPPFDLRERSPVFRKSKGRGGASPLEVDTNGCRIPTIPTGDRGCGLWDMPLSLTHQSDKGRQATNCIARNEIFRIALRVTTPVHLRHPDIRIDPIGIDYLVCSTHQCVKLLSRYQCGQYRKLVPTLLDKTVPQHRSLDIV